MALLYAVDTNILLRLVDTQDPRHPSIQASMASLTGQGAEFCYAQQSLGEFWNVCTRPLTANGFGLNIEEIGFQLKLIEKTMMLLPDDQRTYYAWRNLLVSNAVRGVQVHDAHLAAVLEVHGVRNLLTLNGSDFKRYRNVIQIHPSELKPEICDWDRRSLVADAVLCRG